jgi:hypothetical protein
LLVVIGEVVREEVEDMFLCVAGWLG